MEEAARALLQQISILAGPPTNARNFMVLDVYGRGSTAPQGERFKQTIYSGLNRFHVDPSNSNSIDGKLNFAYVDFSRIFNGVFSSNPGFQAFGYTSSDACIFCNSDGCNMNNMCNDPAHWFQWYPG